MNSLIVAGDTSYVSAVSVLDLSSLNPLLIKSISSKSLFTQSTSPTRPKSTISSSILLAGFLCANIKLESMGVQIDTLTPEQEEYLHSWKL